MIFSTAPFHSTSSSLQPPSDPLPPDLLAQWLCLEVMMVKKIYTQECTFPHHPCASDRAATSYFCTSPFPLHTMQGTTVAINPPAHSIPGCPHSYLGTSFIFYTPTQLNCTALKCTALPSVTTLHFHFSALHV